VLKVGTDEFFVTNVSTTTTTTAAGSQTSPSVTVQPFFSGIVLDRHAADRPGQQHHLHIHPAVSEVTKAPGSEPRGGNPSITLPLAKSTVNETDTIVRVTTATSSRSAPDERRRARLARRHSGLADDSVLRNTSRTARKRELVTC